ncbi:MAG TPA: cytochrome c peroxidase, partial [Gammaproteobacteria bacterium]|nr:cytochrome c peroxidase [Gammaproteobacteria bacterium]
MRGRSSLFELVVLAVSCALVCPGIVAGDEPRARLPAPARDTDFQQPRTELVELGRLLFFDKEQSGNRDIACATCHSPLIATGDGLSTNIGTGGEGLSVSRGAGHYPPRSRDPLSRGQRNMTPLFNLGHAQFDRFFWDGRLAVDPSIPQGFLTPAGANLPFGFPSALAALSVFAQTERQEMLAEPGTNELADASLLHAEPGVWAGLVRRLGAIPEYVELFTAAFPEVGGDGDRITIVHVGSALAAFQAVAFRSDNSPFDRYLRGDRTAMGAAAVRGTHLFYGRAGCAGCHGGVFQTDLGFHAIGVPQIGPGMGDGPSGREDFGRERVTHDPDDRYRFRTPSLRNVALTGPWGHDGAFNSLAAIVRHHLSPQNSLARYDPAQVVMPPRPDLDALDLVVHGDRAVVAAIASAIELGPLQPALAEREVLDVLEFLHALTDPSATDL